MAVTLLAGSQASERARQSLISATSGPDLPECLEASTAGRQRAPTGPAPGTVVASVVGTVVVSAAGMAVVSADGMASGGMRPEGAVASVVGTATGAKPIDHRRANHVGLDPCTRGPTGSL